MLELGGKDPMIVLRRRHLEHAIAGALWGGFANAGQTCSGIERVYVVREVAERFIDGVVAGAQAAARGRPDELGHRDRADGLARAVRDRAGAGRRRGGARGATLHCGGPVDAPAGLDGAFYAPAVLTGVTARHADHARGDLRPGGADHRSSTPRTRRSRWPTTRSSASARRSGRRTAARASGSRGELESGMVWINDHMFSHGACQCAWGGVKDSGPRAHALEVRPVRVRERQAAHVGAARARATSGGTRTTRRSAGRSAPTAKLLYGTPPIRAQARPAGRRSCR